MVRNWSPSRTKYTKAIIKKVKDLRKEGCTWPRVCAILMEQDRFAVEPGSLATRFSLMGIRCPRGK